MIPAGVLRVTIGALLLAPGTLQADVFESVRPSDKVLRESLRHDRADFYTGSEGIAYRDEPRSLSDLGKLSIDGARRPSGLRDTDGSFETYLKKELRGGRVNKDDLALRHPLLLLEYSSPVMADVIKHYRMAALQRLAIETARLTDIERASEGTWERLSRRSEKECLARHQDEGLVDAMRLCQRSAQPWDGLSALDSGSTLEDGRRRIHVLAQALARLGLGAARISRIISMTGDVVIGDDAIDSLLPQVTAQGQIAAARVRIMKAWQQALDKFRSNGRVGNAALEGLSLPGAPVTERLLEELALLEEHEQELAVMKLSSAQSVWETGRERRQAADHLSLVDHDPVLPQEFRVIVRQKKEALLEDLRRLGDERRWAEEYKDLLGSIAAAADVARARMSARVREQTAPDEREQAQDHLLNF